MRSQKIGEIIPFPVWIIPFPICKIGFRLFSNDEIYIAEVLDLSSGNKSNWVG